MCKTFEHDITKKTYKLIRLKVQYTNEHMSNIHNPLKKPNNY